MNYITTLPDFIEMQRLSFSWFISQGNVLAYIGDNVPVPTFFTVCYLILEGKALFFYCYSHAPHDLGFVSLP